MGPKKQRAAQAQGESSSSNDPPDSSPPGDEPTQTLSPPHDGDTPGPSAQLRDDDVPPCTLRALCDIARLCPELDRLVAAFDARTVPDDVDVQQTKLSWFDVVDSPIASPPAVARVVSALFPELLYLVYDDGYVPPNMDSDSGEDVPMPDPEADDTPEARRRAAWATVREMLEVKSEPHTSDYET